MSSSALESTQELVTRAREGDAAARDRLFRRCLPLLRRWARGRLPHSTRSLAETDDLVQITLLRTLHRLDTIELRGKGSFLAYMRQVLFNSLRDEIRRTRRHPQSSLDDTVGGRVRRLAAGDAPDPQALVDYERALSLLSEERRQAVILRMELGMTFPEIAVELGKSSPDAARMMVSRALADLAAEMG